MGVRVAVTQQDIESWLWESANILRGPVDPANLRDFVFPLLFLKRLSDTWDEEQAKAVAKFGKDIDDETAADFHTFQIPKGCHWADLRRAAGWPSPVAPESSRQPRDIRTGYHTDGDGCQTLIHETTCNF